MTTVKKPRTYYAATANPAPERPTLQGNETCDVCVVGAGFSGLSTALHLAESGLKVIIVEAVSVGFGASGRNGGQVINGPHEIPGGDFSMNCSDPQGAVFGLVGGRP